jgi:hypothetical protein
MVVVRGGLVVVVSVRTTETCAGASRPFQQSVVTADGSTQSAEMRDDN